MWLSMMGMFPDGLVQLLYPPAKHLEEGELKEGTPYSYEDISTFLTISHWEYLKSVVYQASRNDREYDLWAGRNVPS